MSWADAVDREAAWWITDPAPGWSAAPPMQLVNGGPFDIVQGYSPKYSPRGRSLYVFRAAVPHREERIAAGGMKEWVHRFVALIQWPYSGGAGDGKLEDEQRNLDRAVDAVLARLRGPLGDKSHNGAFASVAEVEGDIEIVPDLDAYDAIRRREPLVVRIRYAATEVFIA